MRRKAMFFSDRATTPENINMSWKRWIVSIAALLMAGPSLAADRFESLLLLLIFTMIQWNYNYNINFNDRNKSNYNNNNINNNNNNNNNNDNM